MFSNSIEQLKFSHLKVLELDLSGNNVNLKHLGKLLLSV